MTKFKCQLKVRVVERYAVAPNQEEWPNECQKEENTIQRTIVIVIDDDQSICKKHWHWHILVNQADTTKAQAWAWEVSAQYAVYNLWSNRFTE